MAAINPYLNFPGTTEEAFNFYKSVFGGEFSVLQRFRETPEADKLPEEDQDKIMHISLPIGDGHILMATDALESAGQTIKSGNNHYIAIQAKSEQEAEKLFEGLSDGGEVEMELQKTFWGAYYGSLTDKFGVQWMVNYDYE